MSSPELLRTHAMHHIVGARKNGITRQKERWIGLARIIKSVFGSFEEANALTVAPLIHFRSTEICESVVLSTVISAKVNESFKERQPLYLDEVSKCVGVLQFDKGLTAMCGSRQQRHKWIADGQ